MKTSSSVGLTSAVTMPMTWPSRLTSGPPELPGLTAASIWIRPCRIRAAVRQLERTVEAGDDAGAASSRTARTGCRSRTPRCPAGRRPDCRASPGRASAGGSLGADDGDVVLRLASPRSRPADFGAVGERELDRRRAVDDVEAGQDVAGEVDDDAAAEAAGGFVRRRRARRTPVVSIEHERRLDGLVDESPRRPAAASPTRGRCAIAAVDVLLRQRPGSRGRGGRTRGRRRG